MILTIHLNINLDNQKHNPRLMNPIGNSGKIRTGSVKLVLGEEQYITNEDQTIKDLSLVFEQLSNPEEYFSHILLQLVKNDVSDKVNVGKWKNGKKYPQDMFDPNSV